jgi:hypothetical protein
MLLRWISVAQEVEPFWSRIPGNCEILKDTPVPTRAGKFWLVATGNEAPAKLKTKSSSFGRSL